MEFGVLTSCFLCGLYFSVEKKNQPDVDLIVVVAAVKDLAWNYKLARVGWEMS